MVNMWSVSPEQRSSAVKVMTNGGGHPPEKPQTPVEGQEEALGAKPSEDKAAPK